MCLAVPGKIVEVANVGISRIAKVQFGGVSRQIYLDFVPEAQPGDYVVVHVGFAISRLEPEEARRTYELLKEMGASIEEDIGTGEPEDQP
jgi:hydrogenase expression/formation protein HypC